MAPFMVEDATGRRKVNLPRILEALLIAAVIGLFNMIGTTQVFETRFKYMKEQIQEIKASIADIRRDLYQPYHKRDKAP